VQIGHGTDAWIESCIPYGRRQQLNQQVAQLVAVLHVQEFCAAVRKDRDGVGRHHVAAAEQQRHDALAQVILDARRPFVSEDWIVSCHEGSQDDSRSCATPRSPVR
jgi:2-C-methyl-D-erythritol 4-phosphate cytidylyltransferase